MSPADKARARVRAALETYDAKRLGQADQHTLVIKLPMATPSLNECNGWHWSRRYKWTQQLQMLVRAEVRTRNWRTDGEPKRMHVRIARYSSGQLDHDNCVGGCKGLVDALVREGVLHDDSPEWVSVTYAQHRCKRDEARTVVEVRAY